MSMQVIYAKASVERKPEYRQQTLILCLDDTTLVRKIPLGAEAAGHIRAYAENYQKLEDEEQIKLMEKLIDIMEDDDDVQNVWHNWDQE